MTKTERVEALIASEKTQFTENNREWLSTLNEDQLALFEPVAEKAAVAEPAVAAVPAVNVGTEEPKVAEVSADQIYKALGVSAVEFQIMKDAAEKQKAARANKITQILGIEGCTFEKTELETFSDATLDKTLAILTPEDVPFRTAAAAHRTNEENSVPPAPSILLAVADKKEGK